MDVTTDTFDQAVLERSRELPVVVDFWAAWCGPCRMLGPAIEQEAAKRDGKLELAKIDVDAEGEIAARYGIQSIPTVAVFRDGEIVNGFVGAYPAATIGTVLRRPGGQGGSGRGLTHGTAALPADVPLPCASCGERARRPARWCGMGS